MFDMLSMRSSLLSCATLAHAAGHAAGEGGASLVQAADAAAGHLQANIVQAGAVAGLDARLEGTTAMPLALRDQEVQQQLPGAPTATELQSGSVAPSAIKVLAHVQLPIASHPHAAGGSSGGTGGGGPGGSGSRAGSDGQEGQLWVCAPNKQHRLPSHGRLVGVAVAQRA